MLNKATVYVLNFLFAKGKDIWGFKKVSTSLNTRSQFLYSNYRERPVLSIETTSS